MKNRQMHVDYVVNQAQEAVQPATENASTGKNCLLNCRFRMRLLQENEIIRRVNGKRNGWWEVLIELQ